MMKRLAALAALLLAMGLLCGCGLLNNEYVSVKDYTPSVQEEGSTDGKVTVKNFSALKQALLKMAYAGKTEGTIVFDAAYDGDTTADKQDSHDKRGERLYKLFGRERGGRDYTAPRLLLGY